MATQEGQRLNRTASEVVDAALAVHRALGPGLMESAYQACLIHELQSRGRKVDVELYLPIRYRDLLINAAYRIDMLVDGAVLVENKTVAAVLPVHSAQVLTYLRLSNLRLGLLINWNSALIKDGIHRIVNAFTE